MRNQVLYSIIGAAALFLVNACQKPVVNPPELKLPTTSFTDVSAAGDVVVVDYTLTNGVEGSEIKVDGDYDWAKVTAIKSASIEVTVDPNETTEPRTAEFTVSYPGVTKDLSFSITQEAGEAPAVEATVTIEPTSAEVPAEGVEDGVFVYTISPEGLSWEDLTCAVSYAEGDAGGWATCEEGDLNADGAISYSVEPNEGEARTAYVTVSYPNAEDVVFTINQKAAGASAEYDHEITIEVLIADEYSYTAGEDMDEDSDCYFFYMSEKPVDDGYVDGTAYFVWDIYTPTGTGGVLPAGEYRSTTDSYVPNTFSTANSYVTFIGDENIIYFSEGTINVTKDGDVYTFDAKLTDINGETYHAVYTGEMDFGGGDEPSDEVSYEFEYSYLTFYEGEGQNGEDNFFLALSDMPFNADGYETDGCTLANFDIYAAAGTSGVLPAGTYRFDDYNYTEGTFSVGSYIRTPDKEYIYFSDGSIEVTKSGDDYVFEATLTGSKDGKTYKVSYTGAIAEPEAPSEPVALEMKYHQVMYYEGYDSSESDEFCLSLSDMPFADDYGTGSEGSYVAWLDIYAPNGTSGVLPEGTYNYDDSYTRPPMSFVSGSTITYPGEDYGVRVSAGTIEVSKSADGKYSIEARLSLVDGNDYIVTYTGPVGEESDEPEPVDVTFDITVGNVTTDSFTYSIVPSDESAKYFHFATVKTTLVSGGIMSEDGAINEEMIEVLASQYITAMPDMFVHTGTLTDAPGMGVSAGDDVVVLCFALNSDNEKTTETTSYEFTMPLSYDFVMTSCNPTFYEGYGNGGEDNYYLLLSDKEIEDGYAQIGSNNYVLDIYVEAGSTSGRELPVGNYPLGVAQATAANTLGFDYTSATFISEDGLGRTDYSFTEGSVDISKNGDNYIIEGNFTDTEGNEHHFTYTGLVFPELPDVIECQATLGSAFYMTDTDGVMNVAMQFLDMVPDSEGYVHAPGTMITLDVYMPFNAEGKIATGTYEVSSNAGEEYTLTAGYSGWYGDSGCYLINSPDAETNFATYYITSGTIEVSGSPDMGLYNIKCDFVTAEGIPVKCTYSGALPISQMPVIEDFDINLDGATGTAYHYGDYYNTGGSNWAFMLGPASSGDAVQVEIVSETSDASAGIPSGTYVASSTNDSVQPGEFLPGYLSSTTIYGTNYIHFSGQSIDSYTPAVGGTIEIVNNGDGTYEMIFACEADHGNVWSGTWTGTLNISDQSTTYSTKSATASRHGYYTVKSLTAEEKVDIIKSSSFKAGKAQKAKVTVVR